MGWEMAGAAAVQGASGFFGTLAANKANRKLQEKQLNWNKEMWHMNNEYNSPASQMERFREAGLNTHLMYGQGNEGNAGGPPEGVAPPRMENLMQNVNPMETFLAFKKAKADIEQTKANTDWIKQQKTKSEYDVEKIHIETQLKKQELQIVTNELELQNMSVERLNQMVNEKVASIKEMREFIEMQEGMSKNEILKMEKEQRQKLLQWFEVNNLGKLAPILLPIIQGVTGINLTGGKK
jgi:ribosome-binding protein aMBF1 (putative translation factor)